MAANTGSKLFHSHVLAPLAHALCNTGQIEEGLAFLAKAQDQVEHTRETFFADELYRLTAVFQQAQSPQAQAEAEANLQQALSIARRQHAKSWELRAATSLARLWQSQGKHQEAYDPLAPVYGWFTEQCPRSGAPLRLPTVCGLGIDRQICRQFPIPGLLSSNR